jgi:hypothetical protein
MSFVEVLSAARGLSGAERAELVRELADPQESRTIPEHLRQLLPPPGAILPHWKPELTAEGWQQVQQLLAESRGTA